MIGWAWINDFSPRQPHVCGKPVPANPHNAGWILTEASTEAFSKSKIPDVGYAIRDGHAPQFGAFEEAKAARFATVGYIILLVGVEIR